MLKARAISPSIVSTAQGRRCCQIPSLFRHVVADGPLVCQHPGTCISTPVDLRDISSINQFTLLPDNPWLNMEVLPAVAAWAASYVYRFPSVAENAFGPRSCSRAAIDVQELASRLSSKAQVLVAGDKGFDEASRRWNIFDQPKPGVVVVPGAVPDVAATVSSLSHACRRCIAKRVKTRSNMQMSTARRSWPSGASMELPVRSASFRAASKSP